MVERRWVGSWLGGPRSAAEQADYPGEQLGFPSQGRGSVATFGHRLLAFIVDAALCDLVALLFFDTVAWNYPIFFAEAFLLTAATGCSAGQRICRLRVVRLDGQPVGFRWALVRTVLLCLLIPALIWDRDTRGLHDKAANTVVLRG